jgi:hypothetical protein
MSLSTNELSADNTQRIYARLAGFLFLWLIATALTGMMITSTITGSGSFADKVQRIVASERLYRVGLAAGLIETLSALVLAFALYVTLRPVDKWLAQLAMYFRVGEGVVGCVAMVFAYARLGVYTSAQPFGNIPAEHAQSLVEMFRHIGNASYNISALSFSIGSLLFFYVFLKSHYIPKLLSAFGIFASVIVVVICLGALTLPKYSAVLQYGWIAMAIAEIVTGFWLMFAVNIPTKSKEWRAQQAVVSASSR